MSLSRIHGNGMSRRSFLLGAGTGVAGGASLAWLALPRFGAPTSEPIRSFSGRSVEDPKPLHAMPGPYPGRVIEVHHPASVRPDRTICADSVKAMMHRGMKELTGADHASEAWRRFFEPGDVVGIKVNPVGRRRQPHDVAAISSLEVVREIVEGLKSAGVKPQDIILFERYADEFRDTGYEALLLERSMQGVRWFASSDRYDDMQLEIDGHVARRGGRDPHVVGYDPDIFVNMGFAYTAHSQRDDRRFRSHVSTIITRMVNKFVAIPVLKDHRSAGVTLALKNLSHGLNNNVARSHLGPIQRRGGGVSSANQCNTFIPAAASQLAIRQKATLQIMDGLVGVYEGGPGSWNATWGTWHYKSLFFATDPVAMDHVGWDIIDAKRVEEGWKPVARMGALHTIPADMLSRRLAALAATGPAQAAILDGAGRNREAGSRSEFCDRREPEHIILAGTIGMGVFDARKIDHRRVELKA